MALDELLATLEADGAQRAQALLDGARADAEACVAAATAARERRLADALAERRRALDAALETALAACRQEAEREVLAARDEVLGRIRARAAARLAACADARALLTAAALADAAATYLGEGGGTLRCAEAYRARLAPVAEAHGLRLEADEAIGAGAVLRAADGRLTIDATLASLLDRRWPDEAIAVAPRLEGPG